MSQHDFNIANQSFPATRADLNNSLVALASNSSGDAEPTTTYANQWWYETDSNTLKLRNEANTAWVPICILDQGNNNVLSITTQGLTLGATTITATGAEINQLSGKVAKTAGLETIWVPATAMYPATTNGSSALTRVETTALRPDLMVLDFAAAADDFAQFSIAFPKSWNEGTVTFQVFWTPSNTNTDNCIWSLQGVSVADDATIDVAYGTAVSVTDAGIGTVENQQVSPVSGDVTITNAAVDTQTYFQIFRDANAGTDTFSGVARLLGVKLFFTTDAANDA